MKWPWTKTREDPVDHRDADEARERAQKDKERASEKWIDVHDTLRILQPNGFGADLVHAMRRKR